MGAAYFSTNKERIRADLLKHGAVWFRGFDLMKGVAGHREMYEALNMEPCLDPLHSSGLRKFASERDALYEEVSLFLWCCVLLVDVLSPAIASAHYDLIAYLLGQQAFSSRTLHRFACGIDYKANRRLCCLCLFPKGH
jgi:hypothetical protein